MESSALEKRDIDEVVDAWIDITRNPTISEGHFTEDENFLKISTTWSVMDYAKHENVAFQRQFSVLKSSLTWTDGEDVLEADKLVMNASEAIVIDGKKICLSACGTRKAILVEKVNKLSEQKNQIIEIWSRDTLLKSYDLAELDMHENVYTSGFAGTTMAWDKSAEKLAYLAEKKGTKAKPFFSSSVKRDETQDEKKKSGKDMKGQEYVFKQTWGEQLQGMYFSVIVVLDISSDTVDMIELSQDDTEFPTDIQWVGNNSIIGTSYKIPPWRLGLYGCNNRPSRIFQVGVDGKNFRFLSDNTLAAFSPRVRPDGEYVIWQTRALNGAHNRARTIIGMPLKDLKVEIYSAIEFPVYMDFPKSCWTPDGEEFFFITILDGESALCAVSSKKGSRLHFEQKTFFVEEVKMRKIVDTSPGVQGLLWVGNNYLLVTRSSTLSTPFVELLQYCDTPKHAQITKSLALNVAQFGIKKFYGKGTVPSFYIGPTKSDNIDKNVPLIVMPHGGPHSVTLDAFVDKLTLFLQQGFALLKINYIGSLGGKKDETDALLGKIGKIDVEDCHDIVLQTLESTPNLDPERIGLFGGSHGGFLSAHLIGRYPDFYKAAVLLNPVCDWNIMIGTSDIVDCCFAETGIKFLHNPLKTFIPAVENVGDFEKLHKASPINFASKVKAATLLLLATEDLRVPMTQGMNFYRALKVYNKTTEVRVYPDNHSLSSASVANNVAIHSALWFKRFLRN